MTNILRTHSWEYFHLHANQRMSVFNFYLIFIGLLTSGLAKVFGRGFPVSGTWDGIWISFASGISCILEIG